MFKAELSEKLNINITDNQLLKYQTYYELLVDYNKHTNLTRITDKDEVYVKHFLDSLLLSRVWDFSKEQLLCDMGSGAGFPSIPLKIMFPNLKVTIVESQIKRINFLKELRTKLNLDFEIVHARAEDFSRDNTEKFDIVTARALGELRLILEFGVPLLKVNGIFLAPKGSKYQEEIENAKNAIKVLGISLLKEDVFELSNEQGTRANLVFIKNKHVKGYPRLFSIISKKPL